MTLFSRYRVVTLLFYYLFYLYFLFISKICHIIFVKPMRKNSLHFFNNFTFYELNVMIHKLLSQRKAWSPSDQARHLWYTLSQWEPAFSFGMMKTITLRVILVYQFALIKEMIQYFAGNSASCSITIVNYDVNCCCGYIPGKLHAMRISLIDLSTISHFSTAPSVPCNRHIIAPLSCCDLGTRVGWSDLGWPN